MIILKNIFKKFLAKAEKVFGDIEVREDGDMTAFITGEMTLREFEDKCKTLETDGVKVLSRIRVGDI